MKAIICEQYGPPEVLKLAEIEKPEPKSNEILVKVHANSVNYGDITVRNFKNIDPGEFHMPLFLWLPARIFSGLRKPRTKILGSEFSGVIEEVGKDAKNFKKGDDIYGYLGQSMGGNAEYICVKKDSIVAQKPANMGFEEAATIPYGSLTALSILKKVKITPGQKVLINGASGGIGSHALQLAKYYGAEVTGVCGTPRVEFVKALGADKVIDYTKEDFTKNGEKYDLIFDILGKSTFSKCKNSLKPNGTYLLASFKTIKLLQMIRTKITRARKKVICVLASYKPADLVFIKKLTEEGKLKSIIDRSFPLEKTAEAHRYVEEGHRKGSVAITFGHL